MKSEWSFKNKKYQKFLRKFKTFQFTLTINKKQK